VIEYAGAIFLVVGFIFILKITKLVDKSYRVIDISRQSMAVLRNADMSEDDKESAMQSHAKQLAGLFFLITIGGLAAIFLPLALIWGLDYLNLISVDAVLQVAFSWTFIGVTTIVIVAALLLRRAR
jgi:uncharacterized oligopeptide transporter (OPT) family protein